MNDYQVTASVSILESRGHRARSEYIMCRRFYRNTNSIVVLIERASEYSIPAVVTLAEFAA